MMNTFEALSRIDCSTHVEQKNGLSYLSWAWAWAELKKLFPKSYSTVYEAENGMNFFTDGQTCWVKTGVTLVDDEGNALEHIEYLPVMDNRNQSIPLDKIKSTDVNKAIQRSITKAIARHGLGIYIYAGEDLPEVLCDECQDVITAYTTMSGNPVSVADIVKGTRDAYGKALCRMCAAKAKAAKLAQKNEEGKKE